MRIVSQLFPRFEPSLEQEFQANYYERIKPTLRVLSLLLSLMFGAYALRDFSDAKSLSLAMQKDGVPALFLLLIAALTWARIFERIWQPVGVIGGVLVAMLSLHNMSVFIANNHLSPIVGTHSTTADSLVFGQQMRVLMICLGLLRFQLRWALPLQMGVLIAGTTAFARTMMVTNPSFNDLSRFLLPTVAILVAVLLGAFVEEQLARRAFWANYQLEQERNDERHMREQTEGKLQVLAQAIGGIVHDLGGPLTSVQMGAETLDMFLDEDVDKETLHEFTGNIIDSVQMLNFLRLSLIEQTRVLEGKPTPVNIKPVALCAIIEAGRRFQKPFTLARRTVHIECDDVQIFADEMKMVTVFMNLIGNALKYSDGDVSVVWRAFDQVDGTKMLLIAVLDKGTNGKGITRAQAQKLFMAFGRLEAHSQIEGTGLGLLSVQKIAFAHSGEAFLEGYEDGTPDSPLFTTSKTEYPTMIEGDFRTAFVITCLLASQNPVAPKATAILR
ncbi:HAMP domain-containing histidine kinase [bacterium]|nr:MAG: HAMP domain-containing histidine kinase [bacterium]